MKRMVRFPVGLSLALAAIALAILPAAASHVAPILVEGNPSCTDLEYGFGFKIDPPNPGTYSIGSLGTVTFTSDGTYFDWTSTVGVDAVIVKGGPNSNVYVYDPPAEAFFDTGLHSPINPNDRRPFELTPELSHIEFCFDYNLDVSKTAETSVRNTYFWTIQKSVSPDTWNLFAGDSGTSEYTVEVTKGDVDETDWAVSGTITIENNTPLDATIESVTDLLSIDGPVTVDCGVGFPYVLASGGSLECTYHANLSDALDQTNTATVLTSGSVDGGSATAAVDFGGATVVDEGINVDDSLAGSLGTFTDTGSVTYPRTFTCNADAGTHQNIATIIENDLWSASASVTVNCYDLNVTKTAFTSFTRNWGWSIDKSADQTDLTLSEGQQFPVNYSVTVDVTATDSEYSVEGDIWVSNAGNPIPAEILSVADLVSPNISADVECDQPLPYTIPAGGTLHCDYEVEVPDGSERTNTATAPLQNHDYDSSGTGTPGATTDFSGSAPVTFNLSSPDDVFPVSECIDVYDSHFGLLGTVCPESAPHTFSYTLSFGAHPDAGVKLICGDNSHVNTATFVGQDSGATGSDSWTVNANVACEQVSEGCSLTPGYWKTHSSYGPAPYDDAWALLLPNGEDTFFFFSGQTYYQVLWTEPEGNAYYILAHAYIAAQLNMLDGASVPPDVLAAFDQATALFTASTPAEAALMPSDDPTRQLFITLAGILDDYNNGLTGPGHCSE